jgi:hypothetical protein
MKVFGLSAFLIIGLALTGCSVAPPTPEEQLDETVAQDALADSKPDSELGSESDAVEWVEGMDLLDLLTEEELNNLLNSGGGRDVQNVDDKSKRVSAAPAPRNSSGNNNSADGLATVEDYHSVEDAPSNTASDCYGQYAEACKVGFVAPSIEYAGYLSCQKLGDGTVRLEGLVRLVGGNYKNWGWDTATHNGMGIVSSRVSEWPYVLSWYATATFYSMDSRYTGVIGQSGGNGLEFIDESQLDPSCRF